MLSVKTIAELLRNLKSDICDDFIDPDSDSNVPFIEVHICANSLEDYSYQTGDTQFMGPVYTYETFATVYLTRRTNSKEAAWEVLEEIKDNLDEIAHNV